MLVMRRAMSNTTLPAPKLAGGPYVMGVLDLAPEHGDGGAVTPRALAMLEAGADIISVAGEGVAAIVAEEEMARVVPVIAALRAATRAPIAIETAKPAVALAAAHVGASMWRDANALRAPGALESAASLHQPVVLLDSRQLDPEVEDVIGEVIAYLRERAMAAQAKGVREIWIDPGLGVGKTATQDRALLEGVAQLAGETGYPVAVSVCHPGGAVDAAVAAALAAAQNGASMVRLRAVAEGVAALKAWRDGAGAKVAANP
jgi:dihydropteroate synthase